MITVRRVFSLDRAGAGRGERNCRDQARDGGGAVATAARARPAGGSGHSQLGGASGAHAGLAFEEALEPAWERGAVAGLPATARDSALPACAAGAAEEGYGTERAHRSRRRTVNDTLPLDGEPPPIRLKAKTLGRASECLIRGSRCLGTVLSNSQMSLKEAGQVSHLPGGTAFPRRTRVNDLQELQGAK